MNNFNKTMNFSPTAQQPNSKLKRAFVFFQPKSLFIILLLSLFPLPQINAQSCLGPSVDVSQTDNSHNGISGLNQNAAQSFVPSGSLTGGVRLSFGSGTFPEGVFVELYTGGTPPAGTLIGTTNTVTVTGVGWFDFPFPSPVAITANSPHHIRIFRTTTTNNPILAGSISNPYADGNIFANSTYHPFPNFDYAFEIMACSGIGTSSPADVPTLSEWGLLILALLLMTLGTLYLLQPKFRGGVFEQER